MAKKRVSVKGKGADLFFGDYAPDQPDIPPAPDYRAGHDLADDNREDAAPFLAVSVDPGLPTPEDQPASNSKARSSRSTATRQPRPGSSVTTRDDGAGADHLAAAVETIRKAVKGTGREVSFVRLTESEKRELAEVVFAFRQQGLKTTENEINRIAINYLLADYRLNTTDSMLAKVLAALRS